MGPEKAPTPHLSLSLKANKLYLTQQLVSCEYPSPRPTQSQLVEGTELSMEQGSKAPQRSPGWGDLMMSQ